MYERKCPYCWESFTRLESYDKHWKECAVRLSASPGFRATREKQYVLGGMQSIDKHMHELADQMAEGIEELKTLIEVKLRAQGMSEEDIQALRNKTNRFTDEEKDT